MVKIELADLIEIVNGNMAEFSASGHMAREGATYFETPYELVAIYDIVSVPYIVYQEESFVHYRSGKIVDKNKGFISQRAVGKIQRFVWSEELGLPFDIEEDNNEMLVELGAVKDV